VKIIGSFLFVLLCEILFIIPGGIIDTILTSTFGNLNEIVISLIAFLFSGIVVILCMYFFFQRVFQRIKELLNISFHRMASLISFSIVVGLLYSLIAFIGLKFNLVVQKSILLETFGFANILLLFLFTLVVATVEEIVFRGAELSYLLMRFKPWVSVLVISIVFSLGHVQYSGILPYISLFLFGIVTSFLVVKTNTLFLAIGMHCGWNLANGILSQYYILDHNTLSYWGSTFELLEIGILIFIFFSFWIYTRSQFFLKRIG
jgi:membrane protease YdiL (CAAX protease family)